MFSFYFFLNNGYIFHIGYDNFIEGVAVNQHENSKKNINSTLTREIPGCLTINDEDFIQTMRKNTFFKFVVTTLYKNKDGGAKLVFNVKGN